MTSTLRRSNGAFTPSLIVHERHPSRQREGCFFLSTADNSHPRPNSSTPQPGLIRFPSLASSAPLPQLSTSVREVARAGQRWRVSPGGDGMKGERGRSKLRPAHIRLGGCKSGSAVEGVAGRRRSTKRERGGRNSAPLPQPDTSVWEVLQERVGGGGCRRAAVRHEEGERSSKLRPASPIGYIRLGDCKSGSGVEGIAGRRRGTKRERGARNSAPLPQLDTSVWEVLQERVGGGGCRRTVVRHEEGERQVETPPRFPNCTYPSGRLQERGGGGRYRRTAVRHEEGEREGRNSAPHPQPDTSVREVARAGRRWRGCRTAARHEEGERGGRNSASLPQADTSVREVARAGRR